MIWLALCSLFFYGYGNPKLLWLVCGSIVMNYAFGALVARGSTDARRNLALGVGAATNLLVLITFKYLAPTIALFRSLGLDQLPTLNIVLPLGISFYTFTQIGYLIDRREGLAADLGPARYALFVTFFPHLIAGPVLHVRDIGGQLSNPATLRLRAESFAPGLAMFAIGLAKKVLIADPLGGVVADGYAHAQALSLIPAWIVIVGYSVELYFDFSGYSDMAVGLAGMFGMKFPLNFNSPYKARDVVEYWQRWHMSLTHYLTLLLYNPLSTWIMRRRLARGLKVSGKALRDPLVFLSMVVMPTTYTMALAGVWHGAGLQFFVFGLIHAAYLSVNHAWRVFGKKPAASSSVIMRRVRTVLSVAVTYVAVLVPETFFRASSCRNAVDLLASAVGVHGAPRQLARLFGGVQNQASGATVALDLPFLTTFGLAMALMWLAPNSQQILGAFTPTFEPVKPGPVKWLRWSPSTTAAVATAVLLWCAVGSLNRSTTFLYFQF